nr:acetylxylan esterase [Promicromonospora thailandica]
MTAPPPRPLPAPYDRWFADSPIDGTYGYDRDALLAVEPAAEPDGFADLWRSWYARSREVRSDVVAERADAEGAATVRRATHDVFVITHTGDGGLRLRAWVALPVDGPPRVGVVHSHGYGGRDAPSFERVPRDAAVGFPVARGLGALNRGVGAPDTSSAHVLHGIEAVDTYAVGRSAVDLWHAATALLDMLAERDPALADLPLYYVGTSFGGGIGALALPWDDRFVGATLEVPTFGQHDLRLQMPCLGSGEAVRHHVADHPEAREVLAFHDASVAATHLRIPVRVECAAWDTSVPPPGQFGVANGVARAPGRPST